MGSKIKKLLDDPKIRNYLRSPELAMLLLVFVSITIILISSKKEPVVPDDKIVPTVAQTEIAESTSEAATTSERTTETTTETTTSTETTAEETTTFAETATEAVSANSDTDTTTAAPSADTSTPASEHHKNEEERALVPANPDIAKYINADISPNADFYQQRIAIAGDSIAYGFNAYGLVPYERNLAQESVSMWNLDYFTFCGGYGLVDAAAFVDPEILYMSLGMNDVNMNDSSAFATKYKSVIQSILSNCTDVTIIVAGITPIGYESSFTSNERIREYNSALENMVIGLNDQRVCYFDAYSVVSDEYGMLRYDCSGGDGIHLQTHCYTDFLNTLYNLLDDTNLKEHIEKIER